MRFLCLHGIGTNAAIFKMQTAALRYQLGDEHIFEFVEGTVPWTMAPEVASISDPEQAHFAYFDPASPATCNTALEQLDAYFLAESPFDAVLGFSQGATLIFMYLVRKYAEEGGTTPPFSLCVLMSPIGDRDPLRWLQEGTIEDLAPPDDTAKVIDISSVLIWGHMDVAKADCELGMSYFDRDKMWSFMHAGGHDVPNASIAGSLEGSVKVIKRAISDVQLELGLA